MKIWDKIKSGITLMHPRNLREHNINALLDKGELTEQEQNMLDDMKKGRAGHGSRSVDYADTWRRANSR